MDHQRPADRTSVTNVPQRSETGRNHTSHQPPGSFAWIVGFKSRGLGNLLQIPRTHSRRKHRRRSSQHRKLEASSRSRERADCVQVLPRTMRPPPPCAALLEGTPYVRVNDTSSTLPRLAVRTVAPAHLQPQHILDGGAFRAVYSTHQFIRDRTRPREWRPDTVAASEGPSLYIQQRSWGKPCATRVIMALAMGRTRPRPHQGTRDARDEAVGETRTLTKLAAENTQRHWGQDALTRSGAGGT